MKLYRTVKAKASAEQVIEKSRFICYVSPAQTREEADAFIQTIKKKHRDATHNVPAMVIGDKFQIQWGSDDGEPQGTSGAPIVQMLVNEGITNTVIVVTRYFGGIKLGTGGLVRAYTSSAKLGLEAAEVIDVEEEVILDVEADYSFLARLEKAGAEENYAIKDIRYTDVVRLTIMTSPEREEEVKELLSELTGGKAVVTNI